MFYISPVFIRFGVRRQGVWAIIISVIGSRLSGLKDQD
jgi:hypothetical protein